MATPLGNPEYTYEYFQQEDVCRLCWNRSRAEPIHSKTDLLDKIADCLNIVLTTHLPNNACDECCTQIDKFYNFKKLCQSTDKKLQEIINNYLNSENKFNYKSKGTSTYCSVCRIEFHTIDKFKNHNIQHHDNENHGINSYDVKNHGINHIDIKNDGIDNYDIVQSHDIENHDISSYDVKNRGLDNHNIKNHSMDHINIQNDVLENCDINNHDSDHLDIKNHSIENHDIDNNSIKNEDIDHGIDLNVNHDIDDLKNIGKENHDVENHGIVYKIQNKDIDNGKNSPKIEEQAAGDYRKWKYKPKRTPTYCNVCLIDYQTIDKFKHHNIQNHGIDNGVFKCFGCEKTFKNRKARFCHEKNFCKGLKDGYKCTVCERFLPKRGVFESHMRDHRENVPIKLPDKLFQCQKCSKLFKSREVLNCHVEAEHEGDKKNYVCESCGRVFTRKDYLNKHKLTHTGDKQHMCPHCDFRTIQRSSLIVHIRKHTGERPYKCSICPQRCVSSSNLRAHLRRHVGLKIHECTICNKKFGYKVSLREHMTSHAPAQHPCPHCSASYTRPRALRRHLAGKHAHK